MAEESMSENRGRVSLGVQAYRWLVAAGLGILVLLSNKTLQGIDDTAKDVRAIQIEMRTMQGTSEGRFTSHAQRLDTIDRRNDAQDAKLDGLWQRFWTLPNPPKGNP